MIRLKDLLPRDIPWTGFQGSHLRTSTESEVCSSGEDVQLIKSHSFVWSWIRRTDRVKERSGSIDTFRLEHIKVIECLCACVMKPTFGSAISGPC